LLYDKKKLFALTFFCPLKYQSTKKFKVYHHLKTTPFWDFSNLTMKKKQKKYKCVRFRDFLQKKNHRYFKQQQKKILSLKI